MAGELGDHHQVVAAPHQPRQAGVTQCVRRQLEARGGRDRANVRAVPLSLLVLGSVRGDG